MDQLFDTLSIQLEEIERTDKAGDYERRNHFVFHALSTAIDQGLSGGVRIDPDEPDWPVVFIELPTGQVSWHVPQHLTRWDGHTTEEKYRRVHEYGQLPV